MKTRERCQGALILAQFAEPMLAARSLKPSRGMNKKKLRADVRKNLLRNSQFA
jgi:hypothetical protein